MSFTLPAQSPTFTYTIQGAGSGATFDGGAPGNRILTGTDIGIVTLRKLTFKNSTAPTGEDGGAVRIVGNSSVTLDNDSFFGNKTASPGQGGGAAFLQPGSSTPSVIRNSTFGGGTAATANSATGPGGAVWLRAFASPATVAHTTFRGNKAGGGGGLVVDTSANDATLSDSTFTGNTAVAAGGAIVSGFGRVNVERNLFRSNNVIATFDGVVQGGGLAAIASSAPATLIQTGNRFDRNHIGQDGMRTTFSPGGGGEWVAGYDLTSRGDRFTNNSLAAAAGSGEAEGGGLGLEGCFGPHQPVDTMKDLVAAGNSIGSGGHGAGVYGGVCFGGQIKLLLLDSTVAGNRTSGAGAVGGVAGGSGDKLTLRNSIVAGNSLAQVGGFATRDARFSDVCLPGTGNICAAPRLVNPGPGHADVHETTKSPTLNRGSNPFIQVALTTDFVGQPLILRGVVDMGADEFKDRFGGVPITSKTAKVKNGEARVKVRCPTTAVGHCTGSLRLRLHATLLGSADFVITAGHKRTVHVPLSDSAKSALQSGPLQHVKAKTTARDDLGVQKTKARKI